MTDDLSELIVGHYERHARSWDSDRQNGVWSEKSWHELFVGKLGNGARVLDLGCGSGRPVAQYLAEQGLRVTGVDSSPQMISFCRERLPDHEWIVADMRALRLGERFDGILAWDSLFHLNRVDQQQMFTLFASHASAGALLMFNTGPANGESIGTYRGDPLYHASLSPNEYETLAAKVGFNLISHAANDVWAGGRTVWLFQRC